MGYLTTLLGLEKRAAFPAHDDWWFKPVLGRGRFKHEYAVSEPETALTVSAFFSGCRLLSESIAQMPLIVYEKTGPDSKERAVNTALYAVLHDAVNEYMSSFEWRLKSMMDLLLWGNHYSLIASGPRGAVSALIPLDPRHMRVVLLSNGRPGFLYRQPNGVEEAYVADEILHLKSFPLSLDCLTGISVLAFARSTLGLSLTMENHSAKLFEQGAMHRGVLTIPGILNQEQRQAVREEIRRNHAGETGWHSVMVLEAGAQWGNTSMSMADAEFLSSRKFSVLEVCRWLGIPAHLLQDTERTATFASVEQRSLDFLQLCLMPWIKNFEASLNRQLITQRNRFFCEFLVDGIVRADLSARYAAYSQAISSGWMNRNEVRARENLNTEPGLDSFLVAQNQSTVERDGTVSPANRPNAPQLPPGRAAGCNPQLVADAVVHQLDARGDSHYKKLLRTAADAVMRREGSAIVKVADKDAQKIREWADKWFREHAAYVADVMAVDENKAKAYVENRRQKLMISMADGALNSYLRDMDRRKGEIVLEALRV